MNDYIKKAKDNPGKTYGDDVKISYVDGKYEIAYDQHCLRLTEENVAHFLEYIRLAKRKERYSIAEFFEKIKDRDLVVIMGNYVINYFITLVIKEIRKFPENDIECIFYPEINSKYDVDVYAKHIKKGTLVFTRSMSHLLAIRIEVVKGEMKDVLLCWVNEEGLFFGELDKYGAYGGWPETISGTELYLESKYLNLIGDRKRCENG